MTPEDPPVGESQSNGTVEEGGKMVHLGNPGRSVAVHSVVPGNGSPPLEAPGVPCS